MMGVDRAGSLPISYLELYVRYNTVIWNYMNEHEFRVVPSRGWPTGIVLPSRPQPTVASAHVSYSLLSTTNFVLSSYPPSISADFYLPDAKTSSTHLSPR